MNGMWPAAKDVHDLDHCVLYWNVKALWVYVRCNYTLGYCVPYLWVFFCLYFVLDVFFFFSLLLSCAFLCFFWLPWSKINFFCFVFFRVCLMCFICFCSVVYVLIVHVKYTTFLYLVHIMWNLCMFFTHAWFGCNHSFYVLFVWQIRYLVFVHLLLVFHCNCIMFLYLFCFCVSLFCFCFVFVFQPKLCCPCVKSLMPWRHAWALLDHSSSFWGTDPKG